MVRFQPPSAVPSSRYEEDEEQSTISEEEEEKAVEYDKRSSRRAAQPRPFRATQKAAPTSAGRHRFAAPQLDDEDEETESEQQLDDTKTQDDEADGDDTFEYSDYDSRPAGRHTSLYPQISARTERQLSERKPTARRIPMDDTDELEEDGTYQQRERYTASRDRSSSAARNDGPAAVSRKRFVAQHDDDDEQLLDQPPTASAAPVPFLADSSSPAYLVTPSLLFTPGTHSSPSTDPALVLSQLLASLSTPPASTTGLATQLPGITNRFPRQRRAFGAGWGVDGSITLIHGSSVTVTRVKGDEQNSGSTSDELYRERQGRVDVMVAMLQVHHEFAEAQKTSLPGAAATLSSPRFGGFSASSTAIASASSIAMLCDRYIAALTAVLPSCPPPSGSASTSSLIPARSFSVASQLRHAISVFQLIKVLYAPEYGLASLSSFLSTPPSSSSLSLSSGFPSQSLSPAAASFDEVYARLHHLKEYFKQQLAPLTPVPALSSATPANPPLFSLLSSYMVTEATELALSTRHLRLATLLPSLSSVTADLTAMCASQVSEWQNTGVWDVMPKEERKCFLLLAGHKQTDDMHWLRGLAMHVCYQTEGNGSVVKGLADYVRAVEDGKAKPALPPYQHEPPVQRKERRRIIDDDEDDDQMLSSDSRGRAKQRSHFDTRFELLSVYGGATDLSGLYSPTSSTPNLLDYALSFHLHHALSFSPILPYTDYHALLSSYLSQLEQSGLWHWAVYVLMSVQHMQRRHRVIVDVERLARGIIGRHVGQSRDARRMASDEAGQVRVRIDQRPTDAVQERELWLINHIRVPRHWFTSAHATAAAYYGDFEQACTLYIDAAVDAPTDVPSDADMVRERQPPEEFTAAHRLLVQHVAPAYTVAAATEPLAKLLHSLSAHANIIAGWREGGGLYLEYHRVKAVFDSGTHEDRIREKQALTAITSRIQQLRQSKLSERTAAEETALLIERAALRIMLGSCRTLESKIGSSGSGGHSREMESVDRHETALG